MKMELLCVMLAVSGCAAQGAIVDRVATVADTLQSDAELVLCRGITVGAWVRAYGNDPAKAAAWRVLCGTTLTETPAAPVKVPSAILPQLP